MNETETFQHYQVLRRDDGSLWELGRGAMGVTFKAFDVNLRCEVALKVISSQYLDSELARARFLREARAAAGLRHRNVASVYHLGNDAESFFYSMEFIDGQTVESLVQARGPLPCVDALQIVLQVARALGAAARQGLVHRDIKPANLMVIHEDDEEEGFVVKVIDFGLARPALDAGQSGHITMGGFVGTPQYASPEQIEERDLDTRSDIYSLGITLWYMLVGQPPFAGSVFHISSQHLTADPPWDRLGGAVPEPVRALLSHMLQKQPASRPQTPAKLRAQVEACLRQMSVDPAPASGGSTLRKAPPDEGSSQTGTTTPGQPAGAAFEPGSGAAASATVVQGPAPKAGTIFAGRYQLAELVAEGGGGQVYRAYDGREDGRMVAVKVLRTGLGLSPEEFYHLQGDLGRLRYASHPNLLGTFALERIHGYKYCVMEWVSGFTLLDLLRSRGQLPLPDALNLVGQASDAAAHCSVHRLHRLELAPHQAMVHFPTLANDGTPPSFGALLEQPLARWPAFQLKLDALAPTRGGGTVAPGSAARLARRDTLTSIRGLVEGSYFHALGLLFYELFNGTPPPDDRAEAIAPLPGLSDEGNAVLRRTLSTNPGFGNENEFFSALLAASGLQREEIGLPRALVEDAPTVSKPPTVARAPVAPSQPLAPIEAREDARSPLVVPPVAGGTEIRITPVDGGSLTVARPAAPAETIALPVAEAEALTAPSPDIEPIFSEPVVVRQASITPPPVVVPTPIRLPAPAALPTIARQPLIPPIAGPPTTAEPNPEALAPEPAVPAEFPVEAKGEPLPTPPEEALTPLAALHEPPAALDESPVAARSPQPAFDDGAGPKKKPPLIVLGYAVAAVIVGGTLVWGISRSTHTGRATPAANVPARVSDSPDKTLPETRSDVAAPSRPAKPPVAATRIPASPAVAELKPPSPPPVSVAASTPVDVPPAPASTPLPPTPPMATPADTPRPADAVVVRSAPTPAPSSETPLPTAREARATPKPAVVRDAPPPPKPTPKLTPKPTPKPTPRAAKPPTPTPPRNGDDPPPGFMR